jgi:hypothetical protein
MSSRFSLNLMLPRSSWGMALVFADSG